MKNYYSSFLETDSDGDAGGGADLVLLRRTSKFNGTPLFVVDVKFSTPSEELERKARRVLRKSSGVMAVLLIDIQEMPAIITPLAGMRGVDSRRMIFERTGRFMRRKNPRWMLRSRMSMARYTCVALRG